MSDKLCPQCGEVVPIGERGRRRRFCCDACSQQWHTDNEALELERDDRYQFNAELDRKNVVVEVSPDDTIRPGARYDTSEIVKFIQTGGEDDIYQPQLKKARTPGSVYECWPEGLLIRVYGYRGTTCRYWVRPDFSLGRVAT